MYWVKQTGKGQSAHYDAALQDVLIEQWQLEHDLRTGLEREEFRLVYQPIHDLNTGRIVACEALVRWDHPGRGQLAPADFLAMAEHSGLAVPLGWWILRRACTHARQWSQELPLVLQPRVSVNLSPRQFQQPHLVDQIVETLRASGLPAAQLELEVLEASILADPARSLLVLDALRDLGVRIVIDHFGIGMASVSLLRQLPIDVLKLDRSLVTRLVDNPCQTTIVGAIIDLARTVDIAVLAEGVETLAQRQAVTQLGCQMAQGYVIAHPVEADQVVTVLSEQPPM